MDEPQTYGGHVWAIINQMFCVDIILEVETKLLMLYVWGTSITFFTSAVGFHGPLKIIQVDWFLQSSCWMLPICWFQCDIHSQQWESGRQIGMSALRNGNRLQGWILLCTLDHIGFQLKDNSFRHQDMAMWQTFLASTMNSTVATWSFFSTRIWSMVIGSSVAFCFP